MGFGAADFLFREDRSDLEQRKLRRNVNLKLEDGGRESPFLRRVRGATIATKLAQDERALKR
jgi:hypothetical protein